MVLRQSQSVDAIAHPIVAAAVVDWHGMQPHYKAKHPSDKASVCAVYGFLKNAETFQVRAKAPQKFGCLAART